MTTATLPMTSTRNKTPILGHLIEARRDPLGLFIEGMNTGAPACRYRFGPYRALLVNHPDGFEHVLVRHPERYIKSPMYQGLRVVLGNGLVTSEGKLWRRQRKLVSPAFHHRRLVRFAEVMADATEDLLSSWDRHPEGRPLDVHEAMMQLTFRIVGLTLFSKDLTASAKEVGRALEHLLKFANEHSESLIRLPMWIPTLQNFRFHRSMRVMNQLMSRIVKERRTSKEAKDDLLSMLMEATDGEGVMDDQQLKDELLTLALAGHETTSNALTFTWRLLSQHPDVARKIQDEVDRVLEDRKPTFEDLGRLVYTEAAIKESMRLFPPVWGFDREAVAWDEILGHPVAPGTMVMFIPYALHRDPQLWHNPEGFDPERFLNAPARPRFAYVPFGGGPRVCIGNAFALMEAKIIVSMIARRFTLDLVPSRPLRLDPGVTLRPKGSIRMTLQRR